MDNKTPIFNSAAQAGLILGAISTIYFWGVDLISKSESIVLSVISFALWVAKFVICFLLMKRLMKKFASNNPDASKRDVFRFGRLTALLSAAIYAAATMAYQLFVRPEMINEAAEILRTTPGITPEMMETMENILPQMPTFTFFGNLIYCFLFGLILSAIFAPKIRPDNPFKEQE